MTRTKNQRRTVRAAVALAGAALLALPSAAVASAGTPSTEQAGPAAKNVILVIGDGMSDTQILASRYLDRGRDEPLAMETVPHRARAATFSADDLVTDSAAAASSMGSGSLVENGSLNITPEGTNAMGDTLGVLAKDAGKSVGLISTRDIANATPAGFGSAVPDRGQQSEIAGQYLDNELDVLLGGGEMFFLPEGTSGTHCDAGEADRGDGRDLFADYEAAGYTVARDRDEMQAADGDKLLGIFECKDMSFDRERAESEPSIAEMTDAALAALQGNEQGFFLMVEGGMIDPAAERNDGANAMGDTIALDAAVERALAFAQGRDDTLVVVTADHEAGGMALVFEDRAEETFETADGRTMSIAWATSPGHTGAPVPVRATGPGSEQLDGWVGTEHLRDLYGVLRTAQFGS
ncbi:alkaline phosphatase [Pseudonocardia nematodicida]|uniref:Alkaline phosphatase n=1 Tax=Pseudonocardia nematodicida TaxID=1206997 RepID=A0ABV1K440_9PSEU